MDELRAYKQTGITPEQCQWLADFYRDQKGAKEYLALKYENEQLKIKIKRSESSNDQR